MSQKYMKEANCDDLTLNDKISKVIQDIKTLNEQKQKEFGFSRQHSTSKDKKQQSNDKLMDIVKKEQKKVQAKNRNNQQFEIENNYKQNDDQSSCQFDLTSAKDYNSNQKKYIASPKNQQQQQKTEYTKYENILAAPGSIFVEQKNTQPNRKTILDDLLASSKSQEELENNERQVEKEENVHQQYELEQWKYMHQQTQEMLHEERDRNNQLQNELYSQQNDQEIINHILEEQQLNDQIKEQELKRTRQKAATLSKFLAREKCLKENISQQTGYSNPAKIMNYLKMKKCQQNKNFNNVNEYVSHIDAYNKIGAQKSQQEMRRQKQLLDQISTKMVQSLPKSNIQKCQTLNNQEQSMKEQLENQRKALRDFSNYFYYHNQ